jgi:hypothetical protein
MRRISLRSSLAAAVLALAVACGVPPPDRIDIIAPGTLRGQELGKSETLSIRAFRGVQEHDYARAPLKVTWTSSDTSVARVDEGGVMTITGSGKAEITASVPGANEKMLTASVPVDSLIVSSVEATGDFPKVFTLSSPPVPLTVVVKDEKGNMLVKPKVKFRATDYCVDVSPDGIVRPLAVGPCSVVVEIAGKNAKIDLDVKD